MSSPNQEPQASSKSPNQDSKHMDVLCTLKFNLESKKMYEASIKVQDPNPNDNQDSQSQSKPLMSSWAQDQYLKDMDVL